MTRSTFARFAAAVAIGATVLATGTAANARGGGYHPPAPIVRDHRGPGPVVRDHRDGVRDHRGPYGAPQGGVTVTNSGRSRGIPCLGNLCW